MKLRGLYAITDSQLLAGKFLSYVEAALEGGVTLLQYRDKSSDEARRLREAEALIAGLKPVIDAGTPVIVTGDFNEPSHLDWTEAAVAAGARRDSIEIVDVEDVPLAYLPGNATRVRVKAVGELHVG